VFFREEKVPVYVCLFPCACCAELYCLMLGSLLTLVCFSVCVCAQFSQYVKKKEKIETGCYVPFKSLN
jgi:hypothetical protein